MNALVQGNNEAMKFILNGRTFDTATATTAAIDRGIRDADYSLGISEIRFEDTLYRTPNGAFFVHRHRTEKFAKGRPVVSDESTEMTPEEAIEWIMEFDAAVIDETGLTLPPAA